MSRWEALKPSNEEKSTKPDTQTASTGKRSKLRRFAADKDWQSSQKDQDGWKKSTKASCSSLRDELRRYETHNGKARFDSRILVQSMKNLSVKDSTTTEIKDYFLALLDTLRVQDEGVQKSALLKLLEFLDHQNFRLSSGEAVSSASKLVQFYEGCSQPKLSSLSVQCASSFSRSQVRILLGEETANGLVSQMLLPTLESSQEIQLVEEILQALSELMQHKHHKSALFAPLVQDISTEGKEEQAPNPLRRCLFQAFQNRLFSSAEQTSSRSLAAKCLSRAIEAIERIDEAKSISKDLNQSKLETFIEDQLGESTNSLRFEALQLLRVLLRTYPKSMATTGSKLLFSSTTAQTQERAIGGACRTCSVQRSSLAFFLGTLHDNKHSDSYDSSLAVECLCDLVDVLPWGLWLKPSRSTVLTGFSRVVVESVCRMLKVVRCIFVRQIYSIDLVCKLNSTLFTKLPWRDKVLVDEGSHLASEMFKMIPNGDEPYRSRKVICEMLSECMGGKVTPQGKLTPMPLAVRHYLSTKGGEEIVRLIFLDISGSIRDQSELAANVFCSILRSRPETIAGLWGQFDAASGLDTNEKPVIDQGVVLDIYEALMQGRRDFPDARLRILEFELSISTSLLSLLAQARASESSATRLKVFRIYASFLSIDWGNIGLQHAQVFDHVDDILAHCSDSNAKVRSMACKAIGEFCTQYLYVDESDNEMLERNVTTTQKICARMYAVLVGDKDTGARSMALFSLGNLSLEIAKFPELLGTEKSNVLEIGNRICSCISEKNEKVVGNAIRSIGHWGALMVRTCVDDDLRSSTIDCLTRIIEAVTSKLSRTLALGSEAERSIMSWKQRSAAKKHGWGACNALGCIFASMGPEETGDEVWDSRPLLDATVQSLGELVRCIDHISVLPEKVVVSAMIAIRSIPSELLFSMVAEESKRSGFSSGSGIVTLLQECVFIVYQNPAPATSRNHESSSKLVVASSDLLQYLLPVASISDMVLLLKSEDMTRPVLDFLYSWMVEKEVPGRAFEIVALALQRPGLGVTSDVALEQNFASRALLQYKKETVIDFTPAEDDLDEADEL